MFDTVSLGVYDEIELQFCSELVGFVAYQRTNCKYVR